VPNGVVRLADPGQHGCLLGMTSSSNPYRGFRFPAAIIEHAVWLYHCFSLSLRDVELILAARGVVVSYESIRDWGLRFGRLFANALRRRRPQPGDKWFLDEVFIRIRGKLHYRTRRHGDENDRCSASSQAVTRSVSCPTTAGSTTTFSSAAIACLASEHRQARGSASRTWRDVAGVPVAV